MSLSDRVSHLSERDFDEGEKTLERACMKAKKAEQQKARGLRNKSLHQKRLTAKALTRFDNFQKNKANNDDNFSKYLRGIDKKHLKQRD